MGPRAMRIFTSNDFQGHYPVGTAAVVVAEDEERARELLKAELELHGLAQDPKHPFTLVELKTDIPMARIMQDGDY